MQNNQHERCICNKTGQQGENNKNAPASGPLLFQHRVKRNLVYNNQTTSNMENIFKQQGTMALPVERKAIVREQDETTEERHPNFIESNTQAITLEDLTEKNIIPTFSDNSLTISHQNFIGAVTKVANNVFGELTPVECRVSHPIIGRVPSAHLNCWKAKRLCSTSAWPLSATYWTWQGKSTDRR